MKSAVRMVVYSQKMDTIGYWVPFIIYLDNINVLGYLIWFNKYGNKLHRGAISLKNLNRYEGNWIILGEL